MYAYLLMERAKDTVRVLVHISLSVTGKCKT